MSDANPIALGGVPPPGPVGPHGSISSDPLRTRVAEFVYVVFSRRSRGLSVGIDLTPTGHCEFRCVYCQVVRPTAVTESDFDLRLLETQLRAQIRDVQDVQNEQRVCRPPPCGPITSCVEPIRDIAFAGSGEPTSSPHYPIAARLAVAVRDELCPHETKIISLTNGVHLTEPQVAETLEFLSKRNSETWVKLDAGSEPYFVQINRSGVPMQRLLDNILAESRRRPVVIQSLFLIRGGQPPEPAEVEAYLGRLKHIVRHGGQIARVQVYTVARPTAESNIERLDRTALESIAGAVRSLGIGAEVFE